MADSTTQLDRISDLVDQLTPVGKKQRGMRIEADDWNTLVDVAQGILQMSRLQEMRTSNLLDQRYAPKVHDHLGEVSIAWLDADLQTRVGGENGGLATRQALSDMDSKVQALSADLSRLSTIVTALQKTIDDVQVRDIDRSKTLGDFDRRFKGVEDLRTLVTTVSSDVNNVRGNVDKVLDLRKSLQDAAGNPFDVAKIRQDLNDLQVLGTNLNGADGKPVRLRDVQSQLQDISNVVGTGNAGGLDGRLATLATTIQDTVNVKTQALVKDSVSALRAEAGASETRLRAAIDTSSTQTRDTLQQQFTTQIGATETRFQSTLDTRLGKVTVDVRADALANTTALVNQRLADVPDQVKENVATAVNGLQRTLTGDLQATLTATVASQIKDVETRLNGQVTAVTASTAALTQSVPGLVASQVTGALPGLQATLTQTIATQVTASRQGIEANLPGTINASITASLGNLDTRIATAVGQQTGNIGTRVNDAVTAATKALPDQVSGEVKAQLTAANIDGKIADSARTATTQLRAEMKSALADQDARTSVSVQGVVTLLQGLLATSIATGVKDAKDFTTTQTNGLRTELNTAIDTKVKTSRDLVSADFTQRLQGVHDQLTTDIGTVRNIQTRPISTTPVLLNR